MSTPTASFDRDSSSPVHLHPTAEAPVHAAPSPLAAIQRFDRAFFGHPLGLLILSMNEVWERFSYYGMKALLVLFMTTPAAKGGMGMPYIEAGAVYGLYSCLASTTILPGGWIADVLWGPRKALFWGGVVILAGHLSMAAPGSVFFFAGMGLVTLGTGLLKPSSTIMVSSLYAPGDPRQEAGYTIYYMCINVGALLGPLVCGYLGQQISWHLGFGAAAVGMVFGLVVYVFGYRFLGEIGLPTGPATQPEAVRRNLRILFAGMAIIGAVIGLLVVGHSSGTFVVSFRQITRWLGVLLIALPIVYFSRLFLSGQWTRTERNHLIVIAALFFFSIFYWAAADQRGSLLMLFAENVTQRTIGSWTFPASWFASVNPALIILMTPFFAWLWPALGRRNPSLPAKFAWAMVLTAASFAVLVVAAQVAGPEREKVAPTWLLVHFLLVTAAEMCLSPVGISAFARLAPSAIASQVMGIWFLRGSLAGLLVGAAGGAYEAIPLTVNFGITTAVLVVVSILLLCLTPTIRRLMKPADDSSIHPL